jgi:predicted Zn-dependent protease
MLTKRRILLIGSVGVLVAATFWAIQWRQWSRTNTAANAARKALAERRFDDARAEIDRWAKLAPRSGEPDYVRAQLELTLQHPNEVVAAIKRATDLGLDEKKLTVMRAILQTRAGQFAAAEPVLRPEFVSGAEPRVAIAEAMARIYLSTYRLTEAGVALDRWIAAAPTDPRPHLWRNEIESRIGNDPAVTIRNYRTALQLDPNLDEARLGLAETLLKAHSNDESAIEFDTYLARNPDSVRGHVGAAQIAVLRGDLKTAAREFQAALKRDPNNPTALRELALIDLRGNRVPSAVALLKRAIDVSPFEVDLHYNYAHALKLTGDEIHAAEELATTDRLRKENDQITKLRDDLSAHPDDNTLRIKVAKWLLDHGHEAEALQWTDLILRGNPAHPETCKLLAVHYEKKGNFGLANYYRTVSAPAPIR